MVSFILAMFSQKLLNYPFEVKEKKIGNIKIYWQKKSYPTIDKYVYFQTLGYYRDREEKNQKSITYTNEKEAKTI